MAVTRTWKKLRILDFDIETRKVGFFSAGRFDPDGCEPIAIAWSWIGKREIEAHLQGEEELIDMLMRFAEVYAEADILTGHYIRKFDLPILNGAMMEHGLPILGGKLTSDTKLDLTTKAGIGASQENLSMMYGLAEKKFSMSDHRWREAARLTQAGIDATRTRVYKDIKQHKHLRLKMIEAGVLGPPKFWKP